MQIVTKYYAVGASTAKALSKAVQAHLGKGLTIWGPPVVLKGKIVQVVVRKVQS